MLYKKMGIPRGQYGNNRERRGRCYTRKKGIKRGSTAPIERRETDEIQENGDPEGAVRQQ